MIDPELVESVHAGGGRVVAWTANDPDAIVALATLGVDGICTDVTDVARRVLGRT
jgi:glycerophosphoryl diester phosphodiesterase